MDEKWEVDEVECVISKFTRSVNSLTLKGGLLSVQCCRPWPTYRIKLQLTIFQQ